MVNKGAKEVKDAVAIAALSALATSLIGWIVEESKKLVEEKRKARQAKEKEVGTHSKPGPVK